MAAFGGLDRLPLQLRCPRREQVRLVRAAWSIVRRRAKPAGRQALPVSRANSRGQIRKAQIEPRRLDCFQGRALLGGGSKLFHARRV
jgi:hypothetical protein